MLINLLHFQAYSKHTSFSAWKKEHTVFHQPSRSVVLIFYGLPFSGKTTFARALSEETGWIRIDLNKINTSRGVGIDGGAITLEESDGCGAEYRGIDHLGTFFGQQSISRPTSPAGIDAD
jgi:hypothetical protein